MSAVTTIVEVVEGPAERVSMALPERVYAADIRSAEQGLPLENIANMAPELRNRRSPGHGITTENDGRRARSSTEEINETLTSNTGGDSAASKEPVSTSTFRKLSDRLGWTMSEEEMKSYGYNRFIKDTCADYQPGTPRLARFMCGRDWSIYRRFRYIHNRLILQLGLEITELEKELAELDKKDAVREEVAWAAGARSGDEFVLRIPIFDKEPATEQMKLLEKIRIRIVKYDELVDSQFKMEKLGPASGQNHRSYFNYIRTARPKKLLFTDYDDYSFHADDFVTTTGSRSNWFRELIKESWVERFLSAKDVKNDDGSSQGVIYSQTALDIVTLVTSVSICVGALLIPVYILFLVPMSRPMMAVTTSVCIIPFACLLSLVTDNDPYQVFVGTATIGAVMIMFLGNISQNSGTAN